VHSQGLPVGQPTISQPMQQQPQQQAPAQVQPQLIFQQQQQPQQQIQGGNNATTTTFMVAHQQQQPQQSQPAMQQPQQMQVQMQQQQQPPQQQQPQHQQQQLLQTFPVQGVNGGWQSDKDYQDRRKMIGKIVLLLQQRKPNAPQEWLKKLPQMAKRLEESLYRSAMSFDEYNDASTLKQRLQQLAVSIGMKTKKMQQAQMMQQQQQQKIQQRQPTTQQPQATQQVIAQKPQQQQPQQQQVVNRQFQQQQQQQQVPHAQIPQPLSAQPQQILTSQQHQAQAAPVAQPRTVAPIAQSVQQSQQQQRMVNIADINPMIGGTVPAPVAAVAPALPVVQPQPQQFLPQQPQMAAVPVQNAPVAAPVAGAAAVAPINGARQVSDRQQVLRHQQQRLLLLRHAAKCQHEDGRCPVTPHCAGMKRLWKHIAECKNQKCLVPHCVSSRYVLSHYHRCKDVRCPVCGPVREAIHRSHEKQKHMQALKQRHQQAVQQTGTATTVASAPVTAAAIVTTTSTTPLTSISGTISSAPVTEYAPSTISATASVEPASKKRRTSTGGALAPAPVGFQGAAMPLPQATSSGIVSAGGTVGLAPAKPSGQPNLIAGKPQVAAVPGIAFSNGQVIMPKHTGPKPQEDHTLINCFSVEQIEKHIASLNNGLVLPPTKLKAKCHEILKTLQMHQHAWVFNTPVDPVELGLPDYFQVIKNPMDLGTVRKKLENGVYTKLEQFEAHVNLTFDNAMLYNPEGSVVYNMAKDMKAKFIQDWSKLIALLNAEEEVKRRNGEACLLCGCEKLLFEPPVFYCNGMNCPSKRIRRNSYYYVAGNNQYHWCHLCFQEIREGATLDLGDMSIKKESLVKKKNDEVHEESWVQCDRCERWVHQICALFNTRQNKDQRSEYACPQCTVIERKKKGNLGPTSSTPMAEDLPRTTLSEFLENHVRSKVDEFIEQQAIEKSRTEGIPIEESRKKCEMGGAITIRQVTSMDRKLEVRDRMKRRYSFKNYPDEFNFRCKCIVVFQNLDGVDVILFGLYVYEHDEKNPPPNKRAIYISYLDSVHYMRPRKMRTFIYHEILIAYLDYARRRGFSTAHIWACPPLKGDDYILYAKPEDQKVPKDDRLRQWYLNMLVEAQKRGIVGKLTNMYDLYFADPKADATVVPYMEGDYFPAEVENIIKDIEDGKTGKKGGSQGKKKDKKAKDQKKKKAGRTGTRSAGLDEDSLKASGLMPPGYDAKSLEEGARDYVMIKLGETIQPMKESFIVAYLAWKGSREEDMVVPKDIREYREKHGITWRLDSEGSEKTPTDQKPVEDSKSPPPEKENNAVEVQPPNANDSTNVDKTVTENNESEQQTTTVETDAAVADAATSSSEGKNLESAAPAQANLYSDDSKKEETMDFGNSIASQPLNEEKNDPSQSDEPAPASTDASKPENIPVASDASTAAPGAAPAVTTNSTNNSEPSSSNVQSVNMAIREGKFAAMAARAKRDVTGEKKDSEEETKAAEKKPEPKTLTVTDSKGRIVKILDDDDEELDCEFLNNRQAFLNLCQGNHYQFDQLRRAKHTSMMVLWHLHNRDAPKFVQQCATCSREILSGYRYHCPTCADFDQCQDCVTNQKVPRHPHPLKPVPIASGQQAELTEAQRKERQRSIQLHMTLLLHAATCNSPKCPSANCTKMKGLLKHGAQCQVKATGGCNVCKRIWALLQIHARQCKALACPVPNCMAIRERVRQLRKQQQAMDDRRRQEMNRVYRGKR
jgi:E1A/CREB-binding protein